MVVQQAVINALASGANTIVSAQTGKIIRVIALHFVCASAVTVTWQSTTASKATNIIPAQSFGANGGVSDCWNPTGDLSGAYLFDTGIGEALSMTLGSGVQVSGTVNYLLV